MSANKQSALLSIAGEWQLSTQCGSRRSRFAWRKADTRNPLASPHLQGLSAQKITENSALDNEVLVNQSPAHAELIATFRRAEVDAARKFGLIKAVKNKGPKAIQAAVETAAKAAKRRDSYAEKLNILGVSLKD